MYSGGDLALAQGGLVNYRDVDNGSFGVGGGGGFDERRNALSWEPCRAVVIGSGPDQELFQCEGDWPRSLQVSVVLDKPLSWDAEKREWRWHKTWRLPEICVRVADAKMRPNLEARLSTVCVGSHSNELDDVGLSAPDGSQRFAVSQLVDSECRFSRLRLLGTSNTHGGRRFHFLVSVVQRDALGNQQVLASLISSAFSVYSRKDADKKRKKTDVVGGSPDGFTTFTPFAPELFTRTFVKKISDHNGRTLEEPIENNWLGLMRYFQAPNIRFKSRHPLLLAVRFSNVIVLLRDSQHFPEMDEFAIRNFLCACNFPPQCRTPNCLSCYVRQIGRLEKGDGTSLAPWHISMRRNQPCPLEARRWLSEHLSCVKSNVIGFIQDPSMLPARFVPTENIQEIEEMYVKLYALEFSAKGPVDGLGGGKSIRMLEPGNGQLGQRLPQSNLNAAGSPQPGVAKEEYNVYGEVGQLPPTDTKTETKDGFAKYFFGLHDALRDLLEKFKEASSDAVAECTEKRTHDLLEALFKFTEALAIHSNMEEQTMFPELNKRVPGVVEAYALDHYRESRDLAAIHEKICSLDENNVADLYMNIHEFAALCRAHMEKEEAHLLPYFLREFSDEEIFDLMQASIAARNLSAATPVNME